jgi:hypothetical protein
MFKKVNTAGILAKAGVAACLGTAAFLGIASSPAAAAGTGNTVNNCYGVYFTRDWNQECGAGGADVAGLYHSTGDCTLSNDREVERRRAKGDATSVDGRDCMYQVINVRTVFS